MLTTRTFIAATLLATTLSAHASWIDFNFSAGGAYSKLSNHAAVNVGDGIVNRYYTRKRDHFEAVYGGGISKTFDTQYCCIPFSVALGLQFNYQNYNNVHGTEYAFTDTGAVSFFHYGFRTKSYSLLVEPKLIYTQYFLQPYVLLGLGSAWNVLTKYHEGLLHPAPGVIPPVHQFGNHKHTDFAYELGTGVQTLLYDDKTNQVKYYVSLDYRYLNNGKGELGHFYGMHSKDRLHISNISSNALVFTLKVSV